MVDVRYLVDIANVSAGEVVPQTAGTAEWLSQRGLAEILAAEDAMERESDDSFVAAALAPEPEEADEVVSEAPVAEEPAPEPPKRRPGRPRKQPEEN